MGLAEFMALQGVPSRAHVRKYFLFIDSWQLPSKGISFDKRLNAFRELMRKNIAFSI
jgi:hypothetical protein